jgi:hypothetical protein
LTTNLFPIDVDIEIPKLNKSADCASFWMGVDLNTYAVKTLADSVEYPFTPFDEYFCYELAKRCQIAVPNYNLLKLKDGCLGFGSIWEGGVLENGINLAINEFANKQHVKFTSDQLINALSAIYTLDMFVTNEDRHMGNYMVKHNGDSVGTHSLLAMDFGRSWTSVRFPIDLNGNIANSDRYPYNYLSPPYPTPNKVTATAKNANILWSPNIFGGLSGHAVFRVLNILNSISTKTISNILDGAPDEWCSISRKQTICDWWASDLKTKRIDNLKLRYQNGQLV